MMRALNVLLLVLLTGVAHAQQYRSEVRELETPPTAQAKPEDPLKLLQSVKDPYARALLLRDLAGQAVREKDMAKAAQYLEQALGQGALSGIAVEEMKKDLAQLYMASGNYKKMIPQLEAQVKSGQAPPEILVALGAAYVEQKRYKDAVPLLRKGIEGSRMPDPSWRRALVAALQGAGQERELLPLLEQLLREDPTQADDWLRLAALHLKLGNKERALAVMELAGRLGFLNSEADRLRLATLTAQIGAPFEAASLLQNWFTAQQVSASAENWRLLASLWVSARESKRAITALNETLSRAPDAQLYRQLAQLHMDREEYPQAADALREAVALGARDGATLMSLGLAWYQQAEIERALEVFREAAAQPGSKKLATDWIKYLETGRARDQALAAARERRIRGDDEGAVLSARLGGPAIAVSAARAGSAGAASRSGAAPELTPVGAEMSASRDGRIPAWTGGLKAADRPASYQPGALLPDPYASDKPLFTITAANAAEYREQLSKGHQALLARYPQYAMPVYPTRRSAAYPQAIYDATQENLSRAKLLGSDSLSGAKLGFPFAKPQSGVEILWNHRTRYRGDTVNATYTQAVVLPGSAPLRSKQSFRVYFRYGNVADPVDLAKKNLLLYGVTYVSEAGRSPDFVALFHEPADSERDPRNIWVLVTKIGRMLRIPPVGYDQPFPASEGLEFIDMVDMYNGGFDRYVWKLQGKRELIIPYNAYRLSDGSQKYADLLKPYHLNPEKARYELHRVWVIEATERGGKRHSFGKRVFYVDEDSWNIVLVENHDHQDRLWRFQEGHLTQLYDVQATTAVPTVTYDLKDGRYFANRLFAEDKPFEYNQPMKDDEFLPAAVKRRYSR